jgi:hypothetical protein
MKQVGAYGLHRGYFARHLPDTSFRLKYFIPSAALVSLAALVLMPVTPQIVDRCLLLGACIYGFIVFIGCADIMTKTSLVVALGSIPFVIGTHIAYGFYFLKGFVRRKPLVSRLR